MACLVLGPSASVLGQSLPATVEPGRIVPPTPIPLREGSDIPTITAPPPPLQVKTGNTQTFHLRQVVLEGNTVYSSEQLRTLYINKLDRDITFDGVNELAQTITLYYRKAGYLLARVVIPPQDVTDGTLKLRVVEGYISSYRIEGEAPGAKDAIVKYAQRILDQRPVTAAIIERQLLLMNDLPGVHVKSVLAPDEKQVGGAVMVILAEQQRVQASAGIDTYGSAYLGPERVNAAAQYNGAFRAGDALSLVALAAPDHDELAYFSGSYSQTLSDMGTVGTLSFSHADTKPSLPFPSNLLKPKGEANTADLTLQQVLIRSRQLNWSVNGGLEWLSNATNYAPGFELLDTSDEERVLDVSSTVSFSDNWRGYNQFRLGMRKGFDVANASKPSDPNLSRANGDPEFFKLKANAQRLQGLFGPLSLLVAAEGQWTNDPLLASEEYGVGGTVFGRGFDSSEITGERGAAAKAELIWRPTLERNWLQNWQLYTFYDTGFVVNLDTLPSEEKRSALTSVGLGTRGVLFDRVSGDLFIARPLVNEVQSRAQDKKDDWRMQFAITVQY